MSFRIHATPSQPTTCMIRVKHHQRPTELALAQLHHDHHEIEEESDAEAEAHHDEAGVHHDEPKSEEKIAPASPLPPVIAIHPAHAAAAASLAAIAAQPQDETFKLRRKRRV